MTLIIGIKEDGVFNMYGDRKYSGGYLNTGSIKKITELKKGEKTIALLGQTGDIIDIDFIQEVWKDFIEEFKDKSDFKDMQDILDFRNFLVNRVGLKENETVFMILAENHQITIYKNRYFESLKNEGFFAMGSGKDIAIGLIRNNKKATIFSKIIKEHQIKFIYQVANCADKDSVSAEYDKITLE